MHLQSLELVGFKSFADKSILNFHDGVTAVVGPNGCGKSNVLDAVRWVLGEQSAKALRGGEMADVIFSGTDSRKALGFAEVSLTFTDCGAELGVDWHDVRVTRRVYRDGNSEYLLNKTVCRLRDIQNLFADTGVGRSAYSIMEQGKIDLILSSRPEDRRTVFEEAAGITKYKGQKKEALRKLEATEANLLRIGDIIKEVKRQIGSLQRQAGKARRYQTLMTDLQVLDTHHSRGKLSGLEAELTRCQDAVAGFEDSERETLAKIEGCENELAGKRSELGEIDARIGDARAEVQRLHGEMSAHRSRIEFNHQRAQEITELMERYRADIVAAEAKRSEQANQIEEANTLIESTNRLLDLRQQELADLTAQTARLRSERADREAELHTLQTAVARAENRIAALTDEVAGNKSRREATAARLAELASEVSAATQARAHAQDAVARAESSNVNEQQTVDRLVAELREAEARLGVQQQVLANGEKAAFAIERSMTEKSSRLEILRQLNEGGEGLAKGSQAVLKGLDDPQRIRPALGGALVASLDVQSDFVSAIEAALGRNLHAVILQESALASEILAHVTSRKLGQAALALPELTPAGTEPTSSQLPDGAIAWALDKVSAPENLQSLVRRLLTEVAIAPDLQTALRLKAEHPALQFATVAGEFVSTSGIVFGGTANEKTESLLGRKALISEHAAELAQLEKELAASRNTAEEIRAGVSAAAGDLEQARAEHQAANVSRSNTAAQLLLLGHELRAADDRLRLLQSERSTLEQQTTFADTRISELEQELARLTSAVAEQQAQRAAAAEASEQARIQETETTERLQELRLAVATERQRHENLLSQRQPMAARARELAELIDARRMDIANYERRFEQQAIESEKAEAALAIQAGELTTAEENAASIASERATRLSAVNVLDAELRAIRNSLNELHDGRGKEQVRQTQLQLHVENLIEHVSRRYQIDLREFAPDHYAFRKTLNVLLKARGKDVPTDEAPADASDLEQIIAELTRQLDNMGPVNLDAVHEYDELEQRHTFLESQNNDLTASRKELLDVIARINETTQKLFAETFAQVRVNFREMFAELFGGGRADLSLIDEANPLDCGIEIIAKPPGKQLQSVSLLSGGERTMTAVALLFAIYMVRPSPFCILDEMDAPLDESNINRFLNMLDRFIGQSQFIVITHNKRTIAKADVLYGVTMEERGVSKLVGMRLASEKGADGEMIERRTSAEPKPKFANGVDEPARELAIGR